jgi:hypothetical protein
MIFVTMLSVPLYLKFLNIASLIASATFFLSMIILLGFKRETGCSHAIYRPIVGKLTEHYVKNCRTVNLCFIDLSVRLTKQIVISSRY